MQHKSVQLILLMSGGKRVGGNSWCPHTQTHRSAFGIPPRSALWKWHQTAHFQAQRNRPSWASFTLYPKKKKTSKCEREEIEVSKASKTSENLESIFLAVFYILWAHENIRNPCAFEFAFRGFGDESGFLEAEHTHDNIVNQTEVTEKAEYTFQRIPMPLWDTAVRQREMYGSRWTDCQKSAWDIKGYT